MLSRVARALRPPPEARLFLAATARGATGQRSAARGLRSAARAEQAPVTPWPGAVAPAPTPKGPISGVPGAWKRKPGARATQVLVDSSLADSLANLRFACASPHGPPSPEAIHRVLRHVSTSADLEALTKALAVARRSAMRFDAHTSSQLVDAALRAGAPAYALDVFRRAPELRIFPTPAAFEKLLFAVLQGAKSGAAGEAATLLAGIVRAMWLTRPAPASAVRLGALVTVAHAALGDLAAALQAYADFRRQQLALREDGGVGAGRARRPDARPLLFIARAIASGSVPPEALAANAEAVRGLLADAREDCADRPGILAAAAEIEAALPPPGAAAEVALPSDGGGSAQAT